MSRLLDDDMACFRQEQKAMMKKMTPAKTLQEPEADHSGTETDPPAKRNRKNKVVETPKGSTQYSMEKFMVKTSSDMGNKQVSSSAPPTTWKNTLKEFQELISEELTSLWDSRINFNALVETNLVFGAYRENIKKIGLPEACQALLTKGLEISAISKMIELEMNGFDGISASKLLEDKEKENAKLKATMKLVKKCNKENEKKVADLASKVENLKKKTEEGEQSLKEKDEQLLKLKEEAGNLASEITNLQTRNSSLASENSKLKCLSLPSWKLALKKPKNKSPSLTQA